MDLYGKLKSFLGLPTQPQRPTVPEQNLDDDDDDETIWVPRDDEHINRYNRRGFSVLTDPLEIHKYFEQQMEDMLRNFGFGNFISIDAFREEQSDDHSRYFTPSKDDLRDHFLKSGYDKAKSEKIDRDLDGKVDTIGDFIPEQNKSIYSGSSSTSRTIIDSNGIEIHSSVKDSNGNEESKVTRKFGDKEYTIIKRRNCDGKEETIENYVNMTQDEVDRYFLKNVPPSVEEKPTHWSLFNRFFEPYL